MKAALGWVPTPAQFASVAIATKRHELRRAQHRLKPQRAVLDVCLSRPSIWCLTPAGEMGWFSIGARLPAQTDSRGMGTTIA